MVVLGGGAVSYERGNPAPQTQEVMKGMRLTGQRTLVEYHGTKLGVLKCPRVTWSGHMPET